MSDLPAMTLEEFQDFMREGFDAYRQQEGEQIARESREYAAKIRVHDPALACLLEQTGTLMERIGRHVATNYNADGTRRDPETKPS